MDLPELFKKSDISQAAGTFSPIKYIFRVKARPTTATIPEVKTNTSSHCFLDFWNFKECASSFKLPKRIAADSAVQLIGAR
ncbi:hypothetical protein NECAME_17935 [Necator americanus]|uniref:Uncharacterized protein n=1 Tax=Necator americanus TaxID=51031 RepID=W2TJA9_NECAM|nr:hypothetical protein NECAME_17935 [Necator americanus]ETN81112.1 hypothetical protein NECAME_17935 [Necator americanus]